MKRFTMGMLWTFVCMGGWAQSPDWNRAESLSADTLDQYMSGRYVYPTWIEGSSCFYYDVISDTGGGKIIIFCLMHTTGENGCS